VAEVIATVIGRSLGLPVPLPILVQVMPGRIATVRLSDPQIFFGSQSQREPDLTQFINSSADQSLLIQRLRSWPHAAIAGCFDEWIANEDRNLQNLLFDGGKNFTLIDHGLSFPSGMPALAPTQKNFLLDVSINNPAVSARRKMEENVADFIRDCEKMELNSLLLSVAASMDSMADHSQEIMGFLQQRLPQLGEIIAGKLGDNYHGSLFS